MIAPFPWARSICPRAVCKARSRSVVTGSLLSSRGARARLPFTSTTGSRVSIVRLASVFVKAVLQGLIEFVGGAGCGAVGRRDGRRVRAHRVGRTFVLYNLREDVASPKLHPDRRRRDAWNHWVPEFAEAVP